MTLVKDNEHYAINRGFGTRAFGEMLENALAREDKESQKTSFAPSNLGYSGSCPRYWYYAFNGVTFTYKRDALGVANMEAGSDSGRRLAGVLEKAGILIDSEVEVRHEDPPIGGFIDAIVRWKDADVIVEVKTTKTETWQARAMHNTVPGYQLIQLLIYMYIMNNDRGFFLTENKNTNEIFILPIRMTDEYKKLVEDVFDWMRKVKDNADNGELPTRPFNKSSMQCKGCLARATCWKGWTRGSVNGTDPNPGTVTLPVLELPR